MKATNIEWDYGEYVDEDILLPTEIEIPENVTEDEVSNYLSDLTGFCHKGYTLEKIYKVKLVMSEEYTIEAHTSEEAEQIAREKFGNDYLIDNLIIKECD